MIIEKNRLLQVRRIQKDSQGWLKIHTIKNWYVQINSPYAD